MNNIRLYKYYAPTDYNFDALENGYWFFNKFGHANDPFDCDINLLNLIENKWGLKADDIKEYSINNFAICSFSNDPLNKHLWALYSESYKGFAVEFQYDEEQYADFTKRELALPLFDISYLSKDDITSIKEIPHKKLIPPVEKNMPQARKQEEHKEELFFFLYSIKEKAIWGEEHEKRMLIGNMKPKHSIKDFFIDCLCHNGYKVYYPSQSIKRIIAGINISKENLIRLKRIAKKYNVNVEQVVKDKPFELKLINSK